MKSCRQSFLIYFMSHYSFKSFLDSYFCVSLGDSWLLLQNSSPSQQNNSKGLKLMLAKTTYGYVYIIMCYDPEKRHCSGDVYIRWLLSQEEAGRQKRQKVAFAAGDECSPPASNQVSPRKTRWDTKPQSNPNQVVFVSICPLEGDENTHVGHFGSHWK